MTTLYQNPSDNLWYTDSGFTTLADGLIQWNSDGLWHSFSSGNDNGTVTGQYNGAGIWYNAGVVADGILNNLSNDGTYHIYSSGTDNGVVTGFYSGVFYVGGNPLSGLLSVLSGGQVNYSSGDPSNPYYTNTVPMDGAPAANGLWHTFGNGVDQGYFTGLAYSLDDSVSRPNLSSVTAGVATGFTGNHQKPDGSWWLYNNGMQQQPITGLNQNITGDGLWHNFDSNGYDLGVCNGYLQDGSGLWHSYTSGVDNGPLSGWYYNALSDGLWHNYYTGSDVFTLNITINTFIPDSDSLYTSVGNWSLGHLPQLGDLLGYTSLPTFPAGGDILGAGLL